LSTLLILLGLGFANIYFKWWNKNSLPNLWANYKNNNTNREK
jgi:hypothetical protein